MVVSLYTAELGVMDVLEMTGIEFTMVTVPVAIFPFMKPSLGVTSTVHCSPTAVALAGTVLVEYDVATPSFFHI